MVLSSESDGLGAGLPARNRRAGATDCCAWEKREKVLTMVAIVSPVIAMSLLPQLRALYLDELELSGLSLVLYVTLATRKGT